MKRPLMLCPLIVVLISLSLRGFSGGIPILADPLSGGHLGFEELLPLLPASNLILPGLFLLSCMGLLPQILCYGLIARSAWSWVNKLFSWSKHHRALTGTILLVLGMVILLVYEGWIVGWWPITSITAGQGTLSSCLLSYRVCESFM